MTTLKLLRQETRLYKLEGTPAMVPLTDVLEGTLLGRQLWFNLPSTLQKCVCCLKPGMLHYSRGHGGGGYVGDKA